MINDSTIVRFVNDDGSTPEIGLEEIASLGRSLTHAFDEVLLTFRDADAHGNQEIGRSRLYLITSPRIGSLELIFRPEITIVLDAVQVFNGVPKNSDEFWGPLAAAATAGQFGLALWKEVFRSRGLFDKWRRNESDSGSVNIDGRQIRLSVSARALRSERVLAAFRGLYTAALKSGADRVEVVVTDSEPVIISQLSDRRGFGKAALNYERTGDRRHPSRVIRLDAAPEIRVRYRGKDYAAFAAEAPESEGRGIVVLWGSRLPIPRVGASADVQATVIDDPDRVEFIDEAPLSFEDASYVALVSGSKPDWE